MRELIMNELTKRVAVAPALSRADLTNFEVAGTSLRLVDESRGIWNPQGFSSTLTIISDPDSEYDDGDMGNSLYRYSYQKGTAAGVNTKLRLAIELETPIIMLRKIGISRFVPVFPVYVVDDDPANRQFVLALDESLRFIGQPQNLSEDERRYASRVVRQRLHQPEFRARVLLAYETRCSICKLKSGPLLDAAHITSDADEKGFPLVTNGLSMCKLHHAAYDSDLLGVSPEYRIQINDDLLHEVDGPMLKHGLQEMNGRDLTVPKRVLDRPDRERLATRFEDFQAAG